MTSGQSIPAEESSGPLTLLDRCHDLICRVRALETVVGESVHTKEIEGLLHLSLGAEALVVGISTCLNPDDRVYSSHRPHGHFLVAGADARGILAELAGRETGLCRGRGGSMHLMSERAVLATGIVGGTLPVAVGHALCVSAGTVVVVFFGDGAVQTGLFHESVNLAARLSAPVLFVCENNGVAEFSTRDQHTTVRDVVDYGPLYGIATGSVDAGDLEATVAVTAELLSGIRQGGGPALLEAHTKRIRPHYEGDWREHDFDTDYMPRLVARLCELGADRALLDARERTAIDQMRVLMRSVLTDDPFPDPHDDADLVFARQLS